MADPSSKEARPTGLEANCARQLLLGVSRVALVQVRTPPPPPPPPPVTDPGQGKQILQVLGVPTYKTRQHTNTLLTGNWLGLISRWHMAGKGFCISLKYCT
jgi:hypothetical protein